jgi:hypothetical protein
MEIVRLKVGAKAALTNWPDFIVTRQLPVPEHPPPVHPEKTDAEPGMAPRATTVPQVYV